MKPEIVAVQVVGTELRTSDDNTGETTVAFDTVTGENPAIYAVDIAFANGLHAVVGQEAEGDPTQVWLELNGERVDKYLLVDVGEMTIPEEW